jgi:hypothetical protein
MNGTILLIILVVVVVAALIALVPLGLRGYRLYRSARRAQAELVPIADGLARRADLAAQKAAALGDRGMELSARLDELQRSINRAAVLMQAMREAAAPWDRLRRYVK